MKIPTKKMKDTYKLEHLFVENLHTIMDHCYCLDYETRQITLIYTFYIQRSLTYATSAYFT